LRALPRWKCPASAAWHPSGRGESILSARSSDGVRIETEDNTVYADLFLILKDGVNIREVSRNVQQMWRAPSRKWSAWKSATSTSTLKILITRGRGLNQ
jgi:hypothetical protein